MGKWRYGVVLDAGSSGTRVYVYRWLKNSIVREKGDLKQLKSLPEIKTKPSWTRKIHPGISTFASNPEQVGPDHLAGLLEHARKIVPSDAVKDTPLFLLATAGMRLLDDFDRQLLLDQICSYARANSDFLLPDCGLHIQVIPGVTEGLYGWIATNYLMDSFDAPGEHDHGKGHHTYGFLDMGGASAQIAFAPNATEADKHANDLTLLRLRNVDGSEQEYRVFVTSWLEFGVHEARRRYLEALERAIDFGELNNEIPDPCLPRGLRTTVGGDILLASAPIAGPYLLGTGKFSECLRQTYRLLDKDAVCTDEPCLLHGVHVPSIDFDVNHFIGVSEYWHTTHEIFDMGYGEKTYDFDTYQDRVQDFCTQDWEVIEAGLGRVKWGSKVDPKAASESCFKASWIINMLHDGIGIPRVGLESTMESERNGTREVLSSGTQKGYLAPFQAVNKIHSTEVSWTLGKIVLYASSQVPAKQEEALPVGFGSNVPGVPNDFQFPSVQIVPESGPTHSEHWHDSLFKGESPRRIPGFMLFIFIVALAAFFLCGRARRQQIYDKLNTVLHRGGPSHPNYPKKRRVFGGKLPFFGRNSPYERVLEDGAVEFELNNTESDGSEGESSSLSDEGSVTILQSKRGSSRGSGSPTLKYGLDNGSSASVGLGISTGPGVNAMDRAGLVVRTESRDHLTASALGQTTNGRKSRTGSPTRFLHKSPVMSPLTDD